MAATDKNRIASVTSCFGSDALLFQRLAAAEGLSTLSEYRLDFYSERGDLKADKALGTLMTVTVDNGRGGKRYFCGIVTSFAYGGRRGRGWAYHAVLRPWLWLLTRAADCRIFQDKSTLDIIKEVFRPYSLADVDLSGASGGSKPLPYCVQYRESDFAFVSRLLEAEGIYYYFRCSAGRHTLVLADAPGAHKPLPDGAKFQYRPDSGSAGAVTFDAITAWDVDAEIQTGSMTLLDYDFEKPSANLLVRSTFSRSHDQAAHAVVDYPGGYNERARGEGFARTRLEALQANYERASGASTARHIFPGALLTLAGHPRADQNRDYLVTRCEYDISAPAFEGEHQDSTTHVACRFGATAKEQAFRPPLQTPRPLVQGPQTARVVGKAGEETWTDKYGRVKLQFFWDRVGKDDEKSSCWVRVAQGWAGKRWGAQVLPRVGQEVVVSFLEGDPDKPLVTGCVYNAENLPPYELPAHATRSVFRTNSSKGGGGYNEVRFEDKKGSEQMYFRAEKDRDAWIKNEDKTWIGKDRHAMVGGTSFEQVKGAAHYSFGAERNTKVAANESLEVGKEMHTKAGMLYALEAGKDIHIKAKMNVVIEAGATITLKVGKSFVVLNPTSVAVSGSPILLNSGGKAGKGAGAKPKAPAEAKPADDGKK